MVKSCKMLATINQSFFKHCFLLHSTFNFVLNQERLRAWEAREAKRANDYENYATKEKRRQEEQEREARKLKEFLEDYDDERDDAKFYRGRELQRRLADRYVRLFFGAFLFVQLVTFSCLKGKGGS